LSGATGEGLEAVLDTLLGHLDAGREDLTAGGGSEEPAKDWSPL
jgi:hypothetical protein